MGQCLVLLARAFECTIKAVANFAKVSRSGVYICIRVLRFDKINMLLSMMSNDLYYIDCCEISYIFGDLRVCNM